MTTRLFTLQLDYEGSTQPQAIYGTNEFTLRVVGLDHHRAAPSKPVLTLKNPEGDTVATMDAWASDWTETPKFAAKVQTTTGRHHSIHFFDNDTEAFQFREDNGTGGWIFVCGDKGEAVLFPYFYTPKDIMRSGVTSRQGGRLIGATGKILKTEDVA